MGGTGVHRKAVVTQRSSRAPSHGSHLDSRSSNWSIPNSVRPSHDSHLSCHTKNSTDSSHSKSSRIALRYIRIPKKQRDFGVTWAADDNRLIVASLKKGGHAIKSGVCIGWRLISIGGRKVKAGKGGKMIVSPKDTSAELPVNGTTKE